MKQQSHQKRKIKLDTEQKIGVFRISLHIQDCHDYLPTYLLICTFQKKQMILVHVIEIYVSHTFNVNKM